jgi:hypothetical protein
MGNRQILSATSGTVTVTTLSRAWTSAPISGAFLGLLVASDATVGTPSGWTLLSPNGSDVHRNGVYFFWKYAGSSEPGTVTVTPSSSATTSMIIWEMDDAVTNSPIDTTGTPFFRTTDTEAPFTNTLTTATANVRVFALIGSSTQTGGNAQFQNYTAGFTEQIEASSAHTSQNNMGVAVVTKDVPTSGTVVPFSGEPFEGNTVVPTATAGAMLYVGIKTTAPTPVDISAGVDQTITSAQTATVTGIATGGSGTKNYAWTKVSGPTATFANATLASTTFTPSGGVGTYVLRITVTDTSGTDFDDVQVTVTAPPTSATWTGSTPSTDWTAFGGSLPGVLSDSNVATGVRSITNPSGVVYDKDITTLAVPAAGADLTLVLGTWRNGGATGTGVARLYEGATLRSTSTTRTLPTTSTGSITVVFPAADLVAISPSSWTSGLRVTFTVSAS